MKTIHGRIGALAGAAVLAALLLAPAAAQAKGSHHIVKYKVEKHVTLDGDFETVDLSCETGDYALDGMWRIDHVDQDNDFAGNVLQSVDVYDSYGSSFNPAMWHFTFAKQQPGDAQLKVFVTCLGKKTAANSHQHDWTISPQQSGSHVVAGGSPSVPAYTDAPTSSTTDCAAYDAANSTKSILVAPGYHVDHNANPLRLTGSYPGNPVGTGDPKRKWTWQFEAQGFGSSVDFVWRCLSVRSSKHPVSAPNHSHRLVTRMTSVGNIPLAADKVTEARPSCGDHYKALISGFWLGNFKSHVWFLGMDPRPKKRAMRFLNVGVGATVDTLTHCFNDRTT